jgi:hypothetical protein
LSSLIRIYDETREEKRWISPSLKNATMDPRFQPASYVFKYADDGDGWNDLVLICRGTHVKTIVNGVLRTDWDGAGVLDNASHVQAMDDSGDVVAIQLFGGVRGFVHVFGAASSVISMLAPCLTV